MCDRLFWNRREKGPIIPDNRPFVRPRNRRDREMSLTCRVQYLNDVDPFAYASSYPEPPRPPVHTFSATLPLINQLAAVHRLLRAPHRVSSISTLLPLLIHRLSSDSKRDELMAYRWAPGCWTAGSYETIISKILRTGC